MKPMHLRSLLLTLGLAGLLLQPAAAQTPKLGTIDLRKVFDTYWKTKQADANLKDEAAGLDKERKSMVDQFQKGQENYKKTLDSASDNAVSTEEREKRKKAAEEELVKLKDLENNIQQFDRQARTTLGEKQRRMRDNLLGEIKEVIKARAKAGNYSFILDIASESVNNTPVVLYTNGDNDITDDVLTQLNATAPAGTLKPSSGSAPPDTKPAKDNKK
jgi:outer membrane protein